ncbi:17651_t:CDS:2 [Gigaspora rosea]|nr:17651_t:CDS:2 [Gigaspora rosea]
MSGGRIFPVCTLIQSNINYPEMLKSDDQKSINSSKVISNINYAEMLNTEMLKSDDQKSSLLESTSSEPKQGPNHIMISPKFPPTVDMIELISKKSPDGRIPARAPNAFIIYRKVYVETAREHGYYLPMTIVFSMALRSWESADETVKAEYRRIAKEALRLKELNVKIFNYLHFRELKLIGSGGYANVYSAKFYGKQYAVKSLRNTLRLEHKEAMSFIHEELYVTIKWEDGKFEIPWINLNSFAIEITCGLRSLHEKKYAMEIWCVVDVVDTM